MEKYKFLVFDPKTMESPERRESSVSNELVNKLQELLETLNDGNITLSPLIINPDDLSVRWGIIETINGHRQLTHHVILKSQNS